MKGKIFLNSQFVDDGNPNADFPTFISDRKGTTTLWL